MNNVRISLKLHFKDDKLNKLPVYYCYGVENDIREANHKINLVYPTANQPNSVHLYINSLDKATANSAHLFRKHTQPSTELFFSSPENRIRFEQIILTIGIDILNKVKNLSPNQRPLGHTYPHYKTLGTGTLFFTWRNISNTCPIVFWWDNPAHNWKGLFPLNNRGY